MPDYEEWRECQERTRLALLRSVPSCGGTRPLRVCQACGELCLCHEERCPNCDSHLVAWQDVLDGELADGSRIRCRFRYGRLR